MKLTDQFALTVIAQIDPAKADHLTSILKIIQDDIEENSILPFLKLKGVHFCRFVLVKDLNQLIYSTNFDYSLADHLNAITSAEVFSGFIEIFSCCKDFTSQTPEAFKNFIKEHQHKVSTFYRGHRGLSVELIKRESRMQEAIQDFLKVNVLDNLAKTEIKEKVTQHIRNQSWWSPSPEVKLPYLSLPVLAGVIVSPMIALLIAAGIVGFFWQTLLILVIGLGAAILYLRFLEKNANELDVTDNDYDEVTNLASKEDILVQNQLTHFVQLRPGNFRRALQRFDLWLIQQLATYTYNKGKLGDIGTIHFARWSVIDNGRRLIFFSNFDGSWENYLGDFVDRAAVGLTLAWSNTNEFPKTKFLAFDGATDEARFKAWTRKYQIPTQVWFSAYKNLTVKNILKNHKIALGIDKTMDSKELDEWIKLI